MKRIFKIFLIIIFLCPNFAFAREAQRDVVSKQYSEHGTCTGSDCFGDNAVGLEISIVHYSGSGSPIKLGSILIANKALFDEKTYLIEDGFGVSSIEGNNSITSRYTMIEGNADCPGGGCIETKSSCSGPGSTTDRHPNPGDPTGGNHGYISESTWHYSSNNKLVKYDKSRITNLNKYSTVITLNDDSLPTDAANLNSWITNNDIIKKYADSVWKIQSPDGYFKLGNNFSYSKIDEYYVSLELVKRRIDGPDTNSNNGSFLYLEMYEEEGEPYNNGIWIWNATNSCAHDKTVEKTCEKTTYCCTKPNSGGQIECGLEYNNTKGYLNCKGFPTEYKCYTTKKEHTTDYSLSGDYTDYCWDNKYIHQVYGKKMYGYSSIHTYRELNDGSARLCALSDSTAENSHCELSTLTCKLDSNNNSYCTKLADPKETSALKTTIQACKGEILSEQCTRFQKTIEPNGKIVWKCIDSNADWSAISKKNIFQYYIGPNLDDALVGTTNNNYYKFNDGNCNTNAANPKYAIGIKHYYLPNLISCTNTCGSIADRTSDAYLQCAENYCDAEVDFNLKGNAQKRKSACILNSCQYSYGKDSTPNDGVDNRESINSCSNSSPYNNIEKNIVIVDATSSCSIDNLTGDNLEKTKATIANCVGDQVTDFDGDDTNDTIFDMRTYINVACKETSSTNFYNLTNRKFVAGQGIDYWGKVNGEKECTIYFNLEQWKFDYATVSSQDPEKRKRMLYIYEVYNNALDNNYDPKQSRYYITGLSRDEDFIENQYGEIDWLSLEYDTDKVSIDSTVTEIVKNEKTISDKYSLINQSEDNSTLSTIRGKETLKVIQNMTLNKYEINRYVQNSNIEALYTFDKYCVTLNGRGTIYKAPENGVCYEDAYGDKIWGRNVYYTNLNATRNKDFSETIKNQNLGHNISSNVTIGTTVKDENPYYTDGENCPYEIGDNNLTCTIVISNNEGTVMHGNDIYVYGGVNATLKINEKLGVEDNVETYGITTGTLGTINNNKNIEIFISDKKKGVESIDITGLVETKKGITVQCKKKIHIIDPSPQCGVSCSVEKESDLVYEIKSPEIGNRNQIQTPSAYYTALSTNMTWSPLLKNINDNRYIVRLNRKIGNITDEDNIIYNDTIVYGKVEGKMMNTGEKCYNVCWSDLPELPNCNNDHEPSDTSEIKEHCELYWDKDINNYENYEDCFDQCSKERMCPDDRRNFEEVERTCKNNYATWGFTKESSCINYCYYCPECSDEYIFRQIQVYNPFPYSSDSNTMGFNYQSGDRLIPSNWIGKTGYIKQDDEDSTSITGIKHHQNAEYVIELTKTEIDAIRRDTKTYNEAAKGNNAYVDYIHATIETTNEQNETVQQETSQIQAYKSKFIHNTCMGEGENAIGIFKVIDGEIVSG